MGIWVWRNGSIEQVTQYDQKGEDAIIEQEMELRELDAAAIDLKMPEFKKCFEWIKGMN